MLHSSPFAARAVRLLTIFAAIAFIGGNATAQTPADSALDADERHEVVERTSQLLAERYVFADVAEACGAHLRAQLEAGEFDDISDRDAFAKLLTESLQSVSHDKHMRVRVRTPQRVQAEQSNPSRELARQRDRMRQDNYGFKRVELLEGNVGYLDMRHFSGSPDARPVATAAMNFLSNADAIIFDMRKNGGGNPDMIRYISSYLFDKPTHLNSLYRRQGDHTQEFWTLAEVPGPRMADVPVFVLTSARTFSGAEEFSYNLQTRERATLIGETTGGGANPGGSMPVTEHFRVFVPTGRAINPITGTNWEGVGVKPHIEISADEAYDKALALAQEAAESRRKEKDAAFDALWQDLGEQQAKANSLAQEGNFEKASRVMADAVHAAQQAGLLGEMDINILGYELMGRGQIALAIAVFTFNIEAYPESSNVYDSLGEAYMNDDQTALAIKYYKKSLEINPDNTNATRMIAKMREGREAR